MPLGYAIAILLIWEETMVDYTAIGVGAGAVASVATGIVLWFRQNKVADARAGADIAANYADKVTYHGQAEEIVALRERVSQLDRAFVAISARLAILEASMTAADSHFHNLILCDMCKENNSRLIDALDKTFHTARKPEEPPEAKDA